MFRKFGLDSTEGVGFEGMQMDDVVGQFGRYLMVRKVEHNTIGCHLGRSMIIDDGFDTALGSLMFVVGTFSSSSECETLVVIALECESWLSALEATNILEEVLSLLVPALCFFFFAVAAQQRSVYFSPLRDLAIDRTCGGTKVGGAILIKPVLKVQVYLLLPGSRQNGISVTCSIVYSYSDT